MEALSRDGAVYDGDSREEKDEAEEAIGDVGEYISDVEECIGDA